MRYLAIDLGDKRTGLAVGDAVTGLVSPAGRIERPLGDALLEALAEAIDDHDPDALVIGLPLNMDGTAGPRAALVRTFAARLAARTGKTIHEQDERLTSFEADQAMARTGRTHGQKKRARDALAAAAILRDFLAARAAAPAEDDGETERGSW